MSEQLLNNTGEAVRGQDWSALSDLAEKSEAPEKHTPEHIKQYIKDRYSENIAMLESGTIDDHFLELYKNIMSEYPTLRMVHLSDEDICRNAHFHSVQSDGNASVFPEVAVNLSHSETYAFAEDAKIENISTLDVRIGRAYSIKRLAFAIGADWKACAKNIKLNADVVMLHEFGHAHDFIENYLRPEYDNTEGGHRGEEVLYRAAAAETTNRRGYKKKGPNPDGEWISRSEWRAHERRLQSMGINNYDEYVYAVHQYYRDMPDEAYADKFAYNYILKHWDEYFTNDKNEHDDRIFVDRTREIELDPDFVHILGLKQGLGVEVDRLDKDRKTIKHASGFLAMNMYEGKSMYLYEKGDPKNPGEKWRICQGITDMRLKPIENHETGQLEHYVFFKDANGVEYHISRSGQEPESVEGTPAEMAKQLGLKIGSKVQIIEHLVEDARDANEQQSNMIFDRTLDGTVNYIGGNNPDETLGIICRDGNGKFICSIEGQVSRKWNTYYLGQHEIVPLP